jgi:hypothetical protein
MSLVPQHRSTVIGTIDVLVALLATSAQHQFPRAECGEPFVDHEEAGDGWLRRTYVRDGVHLRVETETDPRLLLVSWGAPEVEIGRLEHWHDRILLHGRIELSSGDTASPFGGCFEGISLLLARESGPAADWSEPEARAAVVWLPALACPHGEFEFSIPVVDIERVPGAAEFQAALLLATHEGNELRWSRADPVIPSSTRLLDIPGPPVLDELQQLLNRVPLPEAEAHDPLALIHCVNALLPLGKDRALAVLREWASLVGFRNCSPDRTEARLASLDFSDDRTIPLVAAALFVPRDPALAFPSFPQVRVWPKRTQEEAALWPAFPLVELEGVPLLLPFQQRMDWTHWGTAPPNWPDANAGGFLFWCQNNAELRSAPIRPSDDPLATLDRFLAQPWVQRYLERVRDHGDFLTAADDPIGPFRLQVLRLTRSVLPADTREWVERCPWFWNLSDSAWQRTRERAWAYGLQWEPEVGDYCAND